MSNENSVIQAVDPEKQPQCDQDTVDPDTKLLTHRRRIFEMLQLVALQELQRLSSSNPFAELAKPL